MKEARNKGHKANMTYNKLYINGDVYDVPENTKYHQH